MDAARTLRLGNIREMMVTGLREFEHLIHDLEEEDSPNSAEAVLVGVLLARGITTTAIHAELFIQHSPDGLSPELRAGIHACVEEILHSSSEVGPLEFLSHQATCLGELVALLEEVEEGMRAAALDEPLGAHAVTNTDLELLLEDRPGQDGRPGN